MKRFIKLELQKIEKTYVTAPERIISDYNNERERISEYNGRQLLEMIQNADDESQAAASKVAYIELTQDTLIIANNGDPFSRDGITSLMYSNLSPKFRKINKIGNKGTGFRSILSWAQSIYIKSYDLSVEFSPNNAKAFLCELIEKYPKIESEIRKKSDEDYPIATLLAPKWIENNGNQFDKYNTYIVIKLLPDAVVDIAKQISALDMETIIFLHNLDQIDICSPDRNESIVREIAGKEVSVKLIDEYGRVTNAKQWSTKTKTGRFEKKNYELMVAYNPNLDDQKNVLYSFFKTDIRMPFPALLHGTFELSSNRNQLVRSKANEHLISELVQLMVETALEISERTEEVSWAPLKLLINVDSLDPVISDLKFKESLIEAIRVNSLFPTIRNEYIKYEQKPIVYKNPYSKILPADIFSHLTIWSDEEKLHEMITVIGSYIYNIEWLFQQLTSISPKMSLEARAKCIKYLVEDSNAEIANASASGKPQLLLDDKGAIVDFSEQIFLSPENETFNVPDYVKVKFLNKELCKQLCWEFNITKPQDLADKLGCFGVAEYNFETILAEYIKTTEELLHQSKENKKKLISNLVAFLYAAFERKISIPTSVPLLNRYGNMASSGELYLGKDYGGLITENLFKKSNKKVFVAKPEIIGLQGRSLEDAARFLKWIGVAEFPRKRLVTSIIVPEEYRNFIYQRLAYPTKIAEVDLYSYEDYMARRGYSDLFDLEDCKELNTILETSDFEDIIQWFLNDDELLKIIKNGVEQNNRSRVQVNIKAKKYYQVLEAKRIQSYILWQIQNIPWVTAVSGRRVKPGICCLSKTLGPELSPIIEIPEINFIKKGRNQTVSRDDVENLLLKLGVANDIGDFSAESIYSILLELPKADPEGKRAKILYKQIVENKTLLKQDKQNKCYKTFISQGQVYAKNGATKGFYPVNNVYYVDNRTFCQQIIDQFPVVELERRSGKDKVKNILGISSLERITFELLSPPTFHALNAEFMAEFQEFKPYIYAFRISKDRKRAELEKLKSTTISLCSDISARYIHEGEQHDLEMQPYEYIFSGKDSTVFLKIENGKHMCIEDMKSDFQFCEAIAEIMTGILKVEEYRKDFRELYGKSISRRNETLRSDLDDEKLVILGESKHLLGIITDPRRVFWDIVLKTAKPQLKIKDFASEEALFEFVMQKLDVDRKLIDEMSGHFDFEDYNSSVNYDYVIRLFHEVRIDLEQFNHYTTNRIDLTAYFRGELNTLKLQNLSAVSSVLYDRLKVESQDKKEQFGSLLDSYKLYDAFSIPNSVRFNPWLEYSQMLMDEFDIAADALNTTVHYDFKSLFTQNMKSLQVAVAEKRMQDKWLEEFCSKTENKSLLYFAETDYLLSAYEVVVLGKQASGIDQNIDELSITLNGEKVATSSYEDLFNIMTRTTLVDILNVGTNKPILPNATSAKPSKQRIGNVALHNKKTEDIGFIGESYVYLKLIDKYGKENVEWVSEYAKKAKENENGNDGYGYDIRYQDEKGIFRFAEIKSSTDNQFIFHISKQEVLFGEKNCDTYEIIFVANALEMSRSAFRVPRVFKYKRGESFTNNTRFLVENSAFTVRFNPIIE